MHVGILIQARSNSTRFPDKIYKNLWGKPIYQHVWDNANAVRLMTKALDIEPIFVIPYDDHKLASTLKEAGIKHHAPDCDENDLVARYMLTAKDLDLDAVIRITCDCPTLPKEMIEVCIKELTEHDYASNCIFRSYPEGWDIQGCSIRLLKKVYESQEDNREHLFYDIDSNEKVRKQLIDEGFSIAPIVNSKNLIFKHLSVDSPEHLEHLEQFEDRDKLWEHCKNAPSL